VGLAEHYPHLSRRAPRFRGEQSRLGLRCRDNSSDGVLTCAYRAPMRRPVVALDRRNMAQKQGAIPGARRASRSHQGRIAASARNLLARVPLPILQRLNTAPLLVLYHAVADAIPDHLQHVLSCRGPATFRRDLDCLLKSFRPVTLDQLRDWILNDKPLPSN